MISDRLTFAARLLHRWLEQPGRTRRTSALVLIMALAALVALVVGAVWLAVLTVTAVYRLIAG